MTNQPPQQCQTPQQHPPQEQVLNLTLRQTLQLPSNHPSVREHLGSLTSSRDRWRGFTVVIILVMLAMISIMLYNWWKQNKLNEKISRELKKTRIDTLLSRQKDSETLAKINNSLIGRYDVAKPPRIIGQLISIS